VVIAPWLVGQCNFSIFHGDLRYWSLCVCVCLLGGRDSLTALLQLKENSRQELSSAADRTLSACL
jgi:hypothetical protein